MTALEVMQNIVLILKDIMDKMVQVNIIQLGLALMFVYLLFHIVENLFD